MSDELLVFSGSSNPDLSTEICDCLGIPLGRLSVSRFSNDNLFVQILENVRERDVFVVQSFSQPVSDHIIELLIIMDALRSASARRITAVVPYFSYARSDKKDHPRISITARLMADVIVTAGANRVLTMTLHADQVHGFFSVPVDHLSAVPVISEYYKQLHVPNLVVIAPDAGHAKRAGQYGSQLEVPIGFVDKRRLDDTRVVSGAVVGDVKGKNVLLVDDEIAAGTSLISTVDAVREAGAREVYAAATHGVLCGPAMTRIEASPLERIVVTNTVVVPAVKQIPLEVLSVAPLFAEAIRRIHTGESVGALFA